MLFMLYFQYSMIKVSIITNLIIKQIIYFEEAKNGKKVQNHGW